MPKFSSHGKYEVGVHGRILVARAGGSWNIEMHHEAQSRSAPLVQSLASGGDWAIMNVLLDSLVCHPDVITAGKATCDEVSKIPSLRAVAWVISEDIEGRNLFLPIYAQMIKPPVPSKIFLKEEPAIAWLLTMLNQD